MSDRYCRHPGCKRIINELPESHFLCSFHMIKLRVFAQYVIHLVGKGLKSIDHIFFLFLNKKGCSPEDLTRYLITVIKYRAPKAYAEEFVFDGAKFSQSWIPFFEVIGIIFQARKKSPAKNIIADKKSSFREFVRYVRRLTHGRSLPESDILFAYMHPEGCSGNELILQIGKNGENSSVTYSVNKGYLKARRVGRYWVIDQDEIIRVLDLERNWIGVQLASKLKKRSREAFRKYARQGLFGETAFNMSGALSITTEAFNNIDQALHLIRKQHKAKIIDRLDQKLADTEFTVNRLCQKYKRLEPGTTKYWLRSGILPFEKRGEIVVIRLDDFRDFAISGSKGENILRTRYVKIMQDICLLEQWT